MISLDDMRPAWRRPTGAQQRRLPLRHKRLAKIIDLAKNLDDPTSSPPSLSDRRLPQKAFEPQSLSPAKTPYPGYHTSDVGAAFGGQAGVKPEAARGGGPKG